MCLVLRLHSTEGLHIKPTFKLNILPEIKAEIHNIQQHSGSQWEGGGGADTALRTHRADS